VWAVGLKAGARRGAWYAGVVVACRCAWKVAGGECARPARARSPSRTVFAVNAPSSGNEPSHLPRPEPDSSDE